MIEHRAARGFIFLGGVGLVVVGLAAGSAPREPVFDGMSLVAEPEAVAGSSHTPRPVAQPELGPAADRATGARSGQALRAAAFRILEEGRPADWAWGATVSFAPEREATESVSIVAATHARAPVPGVARRVLGAVQDPRENRPLANTLEPVTIEEPPEARPTRLDVADRVRFKHEMRDPAR